MEKRVTIYDIAKELSISPSTVSRVLNGSSHPVKLKSRELILDAARRMGYIPNALARNLKVRGSQNIGVLLPSIDNPFYPSIVRGIEDEAKLHECSIMLCSSDWDIPMIEMQMNQLLQQNVRGFITLYLDIDSSTAAREYIQRGGRLVALNSPQRMLNGAYNVIVDTKQEAFLSTKRVWGIQPS